MRRRYKKRNVLIITYIIIIVISINAGLVIKRLEKPFEYAFAAYATKIGNDALNYAINSCLKDISYSELVTLNQNQSNQIVSASVDAVKVSKIKSIITENIQNYFNDNKNGVISLNAASAQNNFIISALGPQLKIKVLPSTITKIEFRDDFISTGINQVRHSIYLDIEMNITVTSFNMRKTQKVTNSIFITDTIIVGNVPQYYGGYFPLNNIKTE